MIDFSERPKDWRIGQFLFNWLAWMGDGEMKDPFHISDERLEELYKEYLKTLKV